MTVAQGAKVDVEGAGNWLLLLSLSFPNHGLTAPGMVI